MGCWSWPESQEPRLVTQNSDQSLASSVTCFTVSKAVKKSRSTNETMEHESMNGRMPLTILKSTVSVERAAQYVDCRAQKLGEVAI